MTKRLAARGERIRDGADYLRDDDRGIAIIWLTVAAVWLGAWIHYGTFWGAGVFAVLLGPFAAGAALVGVAVIGGLIAIMRRLRR